MKNPTIHTGCYIETEGLSESTINAAIEVLSSYATDRAVSRRARILPYLGLVPCVDGVLLVDCTPTSNYGVKLHKRLTVDEVIGSSCNQQRETPSFGSLSEFIKWLVDNDGKKLVSSEGKFVFFDSKLVTPFRIAACANSNGSFLGSLSRWWNETYTIYREPKEPEWFECIPEGGVLCFVSNLSEDCCKRKVSIAVIKQYEPSNAKPYWAWNGDYWKYAVPAKPEDLPFLSQN